jgi:two-component system sensor histidine kinase HydH
MTEVLVLYTPLYATRHIQIEYAVPVDLPLVRADPERLSQVFLYLFRNATEAMPHGGTLHIRGAIADGQGTQVAIEVADTGQGIPAGISIFDLFTTTKPRRLGLGLAIVRYILDIHQSTISYTSLPGYGTCFRLRLPCSAQSSRTVR